MRKVAPYRLFETRISVKSLIKKKRLRSKSTRKIKETSVTTFDQMVSGLDQRKNQTSKLRKRNCLAAFYHDNLSTNHIFHHLKSVRSFDGMISHHFTFHLFPSFLPSSLKLPSFPSSIVSRFSNNIPSKRSIN